MSAQRARARSIARAAASAVVVAAGFVASPAQAELRDVAARARAEWKGAGAVLVDVPARFVYEDETISVRVPPGPPSRCTTVALVAARGLSFHAKVAGVDDDDEDDDAARASSVAGILEVSRCDAPLERVIVTSDAGRGAVEVVVARSKTALPPLRSIFPERTGTSLPAMPEPGVLPPLPPAVRRAEASEARARADGAATLARPTMRAGEDGAGTGEIALDAGCHRVELFANDPRAQNGAKKFRLDLDGELRDGDDDTLLARDRTDSPDARLDTCVGGTTLGNVMFAGAPPSSSVLVTHAAWPLPDRLPRAWGPLARARMAAALLARHVHAPPADPVVLAQGPSGVTPVVFDVERGACYLAVAAAIHGSPRGLGLHAVVGAIEAGDERGTNDDSGTVAFCARERGHARIEVEGRGASLAWALAVFKVASGVWGLAR
jgi:hypothetical protein